MIQYSGEGECKVGERSGYFKSLISGCDGEHVDNSDDKGTDEDFGVGDNKNLDME